MIRGKEAITVQFGGLGMALAMGFAVWTAIARSKAWRLERSGRLAQAPI
jgi:hypothetical protein